MVERKLTDEMVAYKKLRLVPDEVAWRLAGSETPVFISPVQSSKESCSECGLHYTPLIYAPGHIVTAQHFHQERGGIYYRENHSSRLDLQWYLAYSSGGLAWYAIVEPLGTVSLDISLLGHLFNKVFLHDFEARAEKVTVKNIQAACVSCADKLEEGLVVATLYTSRTLSTLSPLCSIRRHPEFSRYAKYSFEITKEGEVLFSNI